MMKQGNDDGFFLLQNEKSTEFPKEVWPVLKPQRYVSYKRHPTQEKKWDNKNTIAKKPYVFKSLEFGGICSK